MNNEVICAACFARVGSANAVCPTCGSDLWIESRLRLVEAGSGGGTRTFVGELRGGAGDGRRQEVAVRVLEMGRLSDWRVYERFRRQGEILAELSHPRIPRPLGDFEIQGRVLHCQTRVVGRTLAQRLDGAHLTVAEAARLAGDLLDLLAHLHTRSIVHRDLTPDAVIIDGDWRAHLVDFSAAGRKRAGGALGGEPEVVGTAGYMAPEQARGDSLPQSDLYALGRLLAQALGGNDSDRTLSALIANLTRDDWRKRPASAAEAHALLAPARTTRGLWATLLRASGLGPRTSG
ncbi:MAG TPA: protein kinase [Polyangia bacterium]|nr:protein kinase [Polyangia bacterium]